MAVSTKTSIAAIVCGLGAMVLAVVLSANAQSRPDERIVGYSVYAHSHYVLLQRSDGRLRACSVQRDTPLRPAPRWDCSVLDPLP